MQTDAGTASNYRPGAVDVHAHYVSPDIVKWHKSLRLEQAGAGARLWFGSRELGPVIPELGSAERNIANMDKAGITRRILCTASWLTWYWLDVDEAVPLVRAANDDLAALVSGRGDRFSGLGSVPLQDTGLAIAEATRCVRELGFVGIAVGTNVNGRYFDDPRLEEFLAGVAALNVPLFFHPDNIAGGDALRSYGLRWLIGNPHEATLALCRLVLGGVLERHAELRVCFPLGGGSMPYVISRLDHGWHARDDVRELIPRAPSDYLDQCYFDTVLHSGTTLEMLLTVVSPQRVILGSDHPWEMGVPEPVRLLESVSSISAEDRTAIAHGNIERLTGAGIPGRAGSE